MDKLRPFILVIMLGAFFASSAFFYQSFALTQKRLPVLGQVADFQLLNVDHRTTTLKNLEGRIWVADFMFTTCAGLCPLMTKNLTTIYYLFLNQPDVLMVSISVNPDNDSPDVLKKYAEKYQVDTSKWFFLTGSAEDIKRISVDSFKLGAIDEPIFHSSYFTLVDRAARIRGYYDGTNAEDLKKLSNDITRLKKEKFND
jgi:protein SCO1/2